MTPERFAQVKHLFLEACGVPREERERWLEQRCAADVALRTEVAALLRAHLEEDAGSGAVGHTRTAAAASAAPASAEPDVARERSAGTIVAGRFRIRNLLGRGGMGDVYLADDLKLDQCVALKFLPVLFASEPFWLQRLNHEVRLARTITHLNVCRVYDINEADGEHFISMEYVDGENLKSLIKRIGRVPPEKAADLARQMCAGLAAAHARGVLHRDLKPANVMVDAQGGVRIMDFGLAVLHDQVRGAMIREGTPAYMAPEQISGADVSVRSDIFALGLVLFELFTGQAARPSGVPPAAAPVLQIPPPSALVPDIPPEAEQTILRCLEMNPSQRPASVLEVAAGLPGGDALRLAQELGQTPSPALVAAARRDTGGHWWLRASLAACAVLLVAAITLDQYWHPLGRAGESKPPVVLAERAREVLGALGKAPPAHEAFGFAGEELDQVLRDDIAPVARYTPDSPALRFWFRCGPQPFIPTNAERLVFGNARGTWADPPMVNAGEALVVLNLQGALRGFRSLPQPSNPQAPPPEWALWHRAAALEAAELTPVTASPPPGIPADHWWAWRRANTKDVYVEAAALGGQAVWYAVRTDPGELARTAERDDFARRELLSELAQLAVLGPLAAVAVPIARRNARLGRTDMRGAVRLAVFVFAARAAFGLLQAMHTADLRAEIRLLELILTGAIAHAGLAWLFYLALEPTARRSHPQLLVSWVRLLAGRWRDPLVGRDLLIGTLAGIAASVLAQLELVAGTAWSEQPRLRLLAPDFLIPLLGPRAALGLVVEALCIAVYTALWLTLLVVLLRRVLGNGVIAGVVATLLIAVYLIPRGCHPVTAAIFLAVGIGGGLVWVALRFGLLPVAAAMTVLLLMLRLPLTWNPRAWYVQQTVFAVLLVGGLAVYGYQAALRPSLSARN